MPNSPDVLFKFSQPSGAPAPKPSASMTAAIQRLRDSTEIQSLVAEAHAHGCTVVVQVYHSAEGRPFLIHLKVVPQDPA